MAKKSRRGRGGDRRLHLAHNAKPPVPTGAGGPDPATQHLALEVRSRLRGDDPLDLLAYVSTLVVAAERPPAGIGHPAEEVDLRLLVETFVAVDIAETTALLSVLGHLTRDDDLRVVARRALMTRRQPMPPWLRDLDETEVTDAAVMTEIAGDGFDIVLGIRWPGGRLATFLVYIDTLHGVVVKDAFPTPEPFLDVVERLRELAAGIDLVQLEPIELGEARAIVEGATDRGEASADPFESDTWPSARPMLRWLLERMPFMQPGEAGEGVGQYLVRQANDDSQAASVVGHFLGSPEAARIAFDDESACDSHCLGLVAAFAVGLGGSEPAGWNPARVEMLFGDWLPSRFLFEAGAARRLHKVVRAFVQWSLRSDEASPALGRDTLKSLDREAADFVSLATSSQAQALITALRGYEQQFGLAGVGDLEIVSETFDDPDDWDYTEFVLDTCAARVGGRAALLELDDVPLPDEAFRWADLPDDIRPRVEEVLALVDDFATGCFDVEFRTVCRRVLALAAAGEPDIFRRKGRADTAAAAVGWIAAKANDLISTRGGMAAGELAERFGVKGSPSQRAQVFLSSIGAPRFNDTSALGRPDLLTSATRASLIRRRDLALADDD
ncbi:MAG: DUF6398 domain-containing protein [Terracoccus sp.]